VNGENVTSGAVGAGGVVVEDGDVAEWLAVVDVEVLCVAPAPLACVDGAVEFPQADSATATTAAAASGTWRPSGEFACTGRMVAQAEGAGGTRHRGHLGQTEVMGSGGDKPRKQRRRLAKVPKYEEPNTLPAQGLTGSSGGVFGSRYGHSADHNGQEKPGRFGAFMLRCLGMKPKS
jgi:hypothetical protein